MPIDERFRASMPRGLPLVKLGLFSGGDYQHSVAQDWNEEETCYLSLPLPIIAAITPMRLQYTMITLHTNFGDIQIELNIDKAPVSSRNFKKYCEDGFYDGTIFHRVINGFMIQGGGLTELMDEKETRAPITNEANRGLKNIAGTIAMARTDAPHSATAQFFINLDDNDFLDHTAKTNNGWGYAVFGKVTMGMDVVYKIAEVHTLSRMGHDDVPAETVMIERATIEA